MARPQKKGLDYFPLDVDIFEDDKLFDISNEFGPLGEVIYLRLLCLVYKNGYYYKFESLDKLALMLIKSIGNRWVRDKKVVSEVIPFLAKCNLFSPELMQENVLTSQSIQRRYQKANERNQPKNDLPYWLIDEKENETGLFAVSKNINSACNNLINVCNNFDNVNDNTTKEIKEKEIKENERRGCAATSTPPLEILSLYNSICKSYPRVSELSKGQVNAIKNSLKKYTLQDFEKVFKIAEESIFLKGENERKWKAFFGWLIVDENMQKALSGNYSYKQEEHSYDLNKFDTLALGGNKQ